MKKCQICKVTRGEHLFTAYATICDLCDTREPDYAFAKSKPMKLPSGIVTCLEHHRKECPVCSRR